MAQYVEVNGQTIEFPDGMAAPDIEAAIKKNMLSIAPAKSAPAFEDPGAFKSGLISAGRATDGIVKGVQQAFYSATGNQKKLDSLAQEVADNDKAFAPLAEARPYSTGLGATAPALATFPLSGGLSLLKAAASAALPSALSYGTVEERLKRSAVDGAFGAAGAGVGQLAGRFLKPAGMGAPSVSKEVLSAADRIGYKPTPAQITQSPFLGNLENYFAKNPGSSGAMQRVTEANQTALNTAGSRAMGETATDLSEGVFAGAKQRIGGEFDRLGQITKPDLGNNFLNSLGGIDAANKARGPFMNKNIDSLIDKSLDLAASNNLSGKAYKEVRTELANQAQTAFKAGDATAGQAYKEVVRALDEAAKSSLSKADQQAWDTARKQWGAYKSLSKGNVAEAGNVSAPRLASVVRQNGDSLRTGSAQGELADIARIGEAFKGVQNPNSGNLVNQLAYQNMLGPFMMLGNRVGSAAYLNPWGRKYFSNGLLDVGQTGQQLMGRAGLHLAVPAGRGLLGVE